MKIVEFLEARITEDEFNARGAIEGYEGMPDAERTEYFRQDLDAGALYWEAKRMLAECEAKRTILELQGAYTGDYDGSGNYVKIIEVMAAVYSDHADYGKWAD